jgi:hypothetical protein
MPKRLKKVKSMSQLDTYRAIRKSSIPSTKIMKDKSKCAKTMRRNWSNNSSKKDS